PVIGFDRLPVLKRLVGERFGTGHDPVRVFRMVFLVFGPTVAVAAHVHVGDAPLHILPAPPGTAPPPPPPRGAPPPRRPPRTTPSRSQASRKSREGGLWLVRMAL